jgi:site-specific DNA-methyltransferase (adenine-specific)
LEIDNGLDPFRKEDRELTAKNSPVERVRKQKYSVPKKTLQLEVKRVAEILQHIPTRDEMIRFGSFPIGYYDEYFQSWGEVTAAARNKGMSEKKEGSKSKQEERFIQQSLL